jgi:mannose-6-phosphate isomerase-like protein (cupin superfamily)
MAEALDVSMVYFLYEQPGVDPVVQANQRPKVTLTDPELTYEVLTPQMNHKMEAIQACIVNGQENFARPLREPTEEFIYILEGRLRVVLESGEYLLSPGDSIYFEGTTLREISNGHNGETRWISVITPPVF